MAGDEAEANLPQGGHLIPGEVSEYAVHEGLVNRYFAPGSTNMANVAHFTCELVTDPKTWADWKSRLPVVVNAPRRGR